jgi:hypothetical protein
MQDFYVQSVYKMYKKKHFSIFTWFERELIGA